MNRALGHEAMVQVFKALGHDTRLKIVRILATSGSKCVCELVDMLPFDQSTISKHLGLLKSVGILRSTKEGLNVTYELAMPCVYQFIKCLESAGQAPCCHGTLRPDNC